MRSAWVLEARQTPSAAERTIRAAIENGINLIDCANVYGLTDSREFAGTSEKVLSKVLKDHRDDLGGHFQGV